MKNSFTIIAGEEVNSPSLIKSTYYYLVKEREIALKNNNYEEWFRISKLLIDEYI